MKTESNTQTLIVLSLEPEKSIFPSFEIAKQLTELLCSHIYAKTVPFKTSQIIIVPSCELESKVLPSFKLKIQVTVFVCFFKILIG